jgi:hypothetical protein
VHGLRYEERAKIVSQEAGLMTYLFVAGIMDGGSQFLGPLTLIVDYATVSVHEL